MVQQSNSLPLLGNRYQLQKTLGTGGMAVVYLARDSMLERPVAIKILRQDYSRNASFRELFRQEAKSAANLSHPNIVTVHDFGLDTGRLFIVMEYVPGTELKTMMRGRSAFTAEEALPLIIQACAGIGYAHRAGLVHCDVKPQNMLVSTDFRLKVTDFGIARALSTIHPDEQTDLVWGSPQYFSPEQASGLAPSPASDVYSLGVILFEMLTGELPFNSKDPQELARLHREIEPKPPSQINPAVPSALEQIILKILSKEPSSRYRTADQLGHILEAFNNQINPVGNQLSNSSEQSTVTSVARIKIDSAGGGIPIPAKPTEEHIVNFDWITVGLGLLALIIAGGLIPFWLFVILRISSR